MALRGAERLMMGCEVSCPDEERHRAPGGKLDAERGADALSCSPDPGKSSGAASAQMLAQHRGMGDGPST